jgi:hypothetical protein
MYPRRSLLCVLPPHVNDKLGRRRNPYVSHSQIIEVRVTRLTIGISKRMVLWHSDIDNLRKGAVWIGDGGGPCSYALRSGVGFSAWRRPCCRSKKLPQRYLLRLSISILPSASPRRPHRCRSHVHSILAVMHTAPVRNWVVATVLRLWPFPNWLILRLRYLWCPSSTSQKIYGTEFFLFFRWRIPPPLHASTLPLLPTSYQSSFCSCHRFGFFAIEEARSQTSKTWLSLSSLWLIVLTPLSTGTNRIIISPIRSS